MAIGTLKTVAASTLEKNFKCTRDFFNILSKYETVCLYYMLRTLVVTVQYIRNQGASVQKTVWTVQRCINGGILSPALVVVCCSGLYCAVLACTGLYWAVLVCSGLYLTVPEYSGLYLVVLGSALL